MSAKTIAVGKGEKLVINYVNKRVLCLYVAAVHQNCQIISVHMEDLTCEKGLSMPNGVPIKEFLIQHARYA